MEEKVLSRMLFLFRCRFHPKSAGNLLGLPRMTATGQNGPLSFRKVWKVRVEINRDQPKSLASSCSSAQSKWLRGTSRVHRPELNRFFPKVRSLIAWSFKLWPTWPQYWKNSGSCNKNWARLVNHRREVALHARERQSDKRRILVNIHGCLPWIIWQMYHCKTR